MRSRCATLGRSQRKGLSHHLPFFPRGIFNAVLPEEKSSWPRAKFSSGHAFVLTAGGGPRLAHTVRSYLAPWGEGNPLCEKRERKGERDPLGVTRQRSVCAAISTLLPNENKYYKTCGTVGFIDLSRALSFPLSLRGVYPSCAISTDVNGKN